MSSVIHRLAAITVLAASSASAHDRHANAAMDQNVHVLINKKDIEVTFKIGTNEEGTFVEAIAMDANGDGKLSPEEQSAYFAQLDARLREGLQISVNDRDVPLSPAGQVDLAPPSQKTFHFKGGLDPGTVYPATLEVHNDNFLDWPGRTTLEVEPGTSVVLNLSQQSSCDTTGAILDSPHGVASTFLPVRNAVDWSRWSWVHAIFSPPMLTVSAVVLLAAACLVMLSKTAASTRKTVALSLIAASLAIAGFAIAAWRSPPVSSEAWETEFRTFHAGLSSALASYHKEGTRTALDSFGSQDAIMKLAKATRVADPGNEKAGAFDLRRVRPATTTILESPKGFFHPMLRVHHEWRAIGLAHHEGHPHERVRDFTCDYTLAVTDHGFQLLDCSDWHQLPDEPVE